MSTRSGLTLFLGFRLHDTGTATLRRVESLLDEIASLEAGTRIPLHWNVPLYPLFGGSSRPLHDLITEIKARVASRGDVLAPAGFGGAVHPLLDDHELERELSWCRRNPWLPGFRELLGQEPGVTIPCVPDLAREAAAGVYSAAGFHIVGLPFRLGRPGKTRGSAEPGGRHRRSRLAAHEGPERFLLSRDPERAAVVAAWILAVSELGEQSPVLASLAARAPGTLLLLLDLSAEPRRETSGYGEAAAPGDRPVSRLIEALSYRHSLLPSALSQAALEDLHPASGTSRAAAAVHGQPLPLAILLHRSEACRLLEAEAGIVPTGRLEQARAYRRSGRRRNEDTRKALELLVPDWNPAANGPRAAGTLPAPAFGRPGQILFAEMGGAVSLPGPEFVAHFVDGRYQGISRGGTRLSAGSPAESSFVFPGSRCVLQTVSAASFEREGDHGLATTFAAEIPKGGGRIQVLVEAYFREGQPELCLECSVRFPARVPALQAALPYEIPLFQFSNHLTPELQTELEDGTFHRQRVLPAEGYLLACGRRLRASLDGTAVVLTAVRISPAGGPAGAKEAPPVTALPMRVCRESGRWALRACLGGRTCAQPPVSVDGLFSRLSFRLGIEEG